MFWVEQISGVLSSSRLVSDRVEANVRVGEQPATGAEAARTVVVGGSTEGRATCRQSREMAALRR